MTQLPDTIELIFQRLAGEMPKRGGGRFPGAKGPKGQPDAFRSCVSCLLSAQSKDANTAAASRSLFALSDTADGILQLDDATVAAAIKPCGLYNVKTRNLKKLCAALIEEHNGVVPNTRQGLMSLPGIGRKCADIVLSFTFGQDVIAVDTHVHRVANRLGLAEGKTEAHTATQLEAAAPAWALADGHFWLLNFGKQICVARSPKCGDCFLVDLCPSGPTTAGNSPAPA